MKPHGISCQFSGYIEDSKAFTSKSQFEAYIDITNKKTNEKITIPMRSFVTQFLDALHKLFSGGGGSITKKSSVEFTGSSGNYAGLQIGNDSTPVNLSDYKLLSPIRSVRKSNVTVVNPYVKYENDKTPVLELLIRRMFTNETNENINIGEIGLFVKNLPTVSNYSSTAGVFMFSRDIFQGPNPTEGSSNSVIILPPNSDIMFDFRFRIQLPQDGSGGLTLNFLKLINNLFFKGNPNNPSSPIINYQNQAVTNFNYVTGASAASTSFTYLLGNSQQRYIGIVAGIAEKAIPQVKDPGELLESDQDTLINPDEKTFIIDNSNLIYSNNEISSITYPQSNTAQFTIKRLITNNTNSNVTINRIGLLMRGNGNGTTLNSQQAFIAINKIKPVTLSPGQSYRAQYVFKISV